MKKFKRIFAAVILGVLLAGALAGCKEENKLAAAFDEERVKEQAMEDITTAESGDFEAWKARFAPELQASLTQEIFDGYLGTLEKLGAFEKFGKVAVVGQEKDGVNYAVAVYITEHEKQDLKYTIAYDENMNLVSFVI